MVNPILKSNIQTIKTAVSAGIALSEAITNLEYQLVVNGTPLLEAKSRSQLAGEEVRKMQADVYIDRDPRIAHKPKTENEKWYFGPNESSYLWPRYKKVLLGERKMSAESVGVIDQATTRIVSQLGSPGSSRFRKQGLVVGRVQSGKTMNFMGLLAKAGDAGYRIIIVLAGTTNTLRYQTQDRLQRDLVGYETDAVWHWLTQAKCDPATLVVDPDGEFRERGNATSVMGNINVRKVAVIKKNAIVLRRVRKWLQGVADQHKELCPVLIVDDECDNASVNTKRPGEDPAAINSEIRDILELLPKVSYVGYTATPFANVLINPKAEEQDLYPRDFLFAIPQNKEYFGPERIFGRNPLNSDDAGSDGNDIVREISKEDVAKVCPASRKSLDGFIMSECESLQDATRYFLMSTAARCWREQQIGQDPDFKSMLVNTSQYMGIHRKMKPVVEGILKKLCTNFHTSIEKWRSQWEMEQSKFTQDSIGCNHEKVSWDQLATQLSQDFFNKVSVIVSNSDPNLASNLNSCYDKSKKGSIQIVIGGNTLSRGITLEGLSTSYFVRTSTTYDTLLQMGRWFGYRRDYEDMPRIWMTKEMEDQFLQLSAVEFEMFQELAYFMAGKSPAEVGLRIRKSPGMQITAKSKMYHAEECDIDYEGFCVQTTFVHKDQEIPLQKNKAAVEQLITACGGSSAWSQNRGHWLKRDANVELVSKFLSDYQFHEKNQKADPEILLSYIRKRKESGGCLQWNIAIKTKSEAPQPGDEITLAGLRICKFQFSRHRAYAGERFAYLQAIRSSTDIFADAADPKELEKRCNNEPERIAERMKYEDGRGLIVIYPIRADSQPNDSNKKNRLPLEAKDDVFGLAIFFPGDRTGKSGEGYVKVLIEPTRSSNEEDEFETEPTV
jgi:hypothetical protein